MTRRRSAFTLLEVLLASAIAVMLMAALYTSLDIQTRMTQEGRTSIDQATLARAVLKRIGDDITATMAPVAATVSTASATTTTSTAATATDASDTATSLPVTPFCIGVTGDAASFTLYVSRLPQQPKSSDSADSQQLGSSDVRKVVYWMASNGGLARREVLQPTADDDGGTGENGEDGHVIAPEVGSLEVSYFDGTAWQESWDGSTLGSDEVTPIGPPRAIAITIGVRRPGSEGDPNAPLKKYRHVVAIESANGIAATVTVEE